MNWRMVVVVFVVLSALCLAIGYAGANESDMGTPAKQVVVEPFVYAVGEECKITIDLKVRGEDTTKCVEYLSTAARLASSELMVNKEMSKGISKGTKKKRR